VDTQFSDDALRSRVELLVRDVKYIDAQPMPLRSIFVALARAARNGVSS